MATTKLIIELEDIIERLETYKDDMDNLEDYEVFDIIDRNNCIEAVIEHYNDNFSLNNISTDDLVSEIESRNDGIILYLDGLDTADDIVYDLLDGKVLFTDINAEQRFKSFFRDLTGRNI
jgi:hypothetical protein